MSHQDGISKEEWERVRELAAAVLGDSSDGARRWLKAHVRRLIAIHGRVPRLIATLADYENDSSIAMTLYKEAYCSARESSDALNRVVIAGDILELHIDASAVQSVIGYWKNELRLALADHPDDHYQSMLDTDLAHN